MIDLKTGITAEEAEQRDELKNTLTNAIKEATSNSDKDKERLEKNARKAGHGDLHTDPLYFDNSGSSYASQQEVGILLGYVNPNAGILTMEIEVPYSSSKNFSSFEEANSYLAAKSEEAMLLFGSTPIGSGISKIYDKQQN